MTWDASWTRVVSWIGATLFLALVGAILRRLRRQRTALAPRRPPPPRGSSEQSAQPIDWSAGVVILNDFRIEQRLGQGGMGEVFLVCHQLTGVKLALKRARVDANVERDMLLQELHAWFLLPHHPHIVACRFFRTVGAELILAADYVAGGSLSRMIAEGRAPQLADKLRLAIEIAWAIDAIHSFGIIHQDIKPSNILLSTTGSALVTDFGLARLRRKSGAQSAPQQPAAGSVTAAEGTPRYRSPEQAEGKPVNRQTDLYSYGLVLLELFAGEAEWRFGEFVPDELDDLLTRREPSAPPLPASIVETIRRCLKVDLDRRWPDAGAIITGLQRCFEEICGQPFPSAAPPIAPPDFSTTMRRQAISDLLQYESARQALEERSRIDGVRLDEPVIDALLGEAAASERGGDLSGAVRGYKEAVRQLEALVQGGRDGLAPALEQSYSSGAGLLQRAGHLDEAAGWYQRAVRLVLDRLRRTQDLALGAELANRCAGLALTLRSQGALTAAVAAFEQAIAVYRDLGRHELDGALATALVHYGVLCCELGTPQGGLVALDEAIVLLERSPGSEPRVAAMLLPARTNRALALTLLGCDEDACAILVQVLDAREASWNKPNGATTGELTTTYINLADCYLRLRRIEDALQLFEKALTRIKQAIDSGDLEARDDLAWCLVRYAEALKRSGDLQRSRHQADDALRLLAEVVARSGRADLNALLQWGKSHLA